MSSKNALIRNVRFGRQDLRDFSDDEVVDLMDYNVPYDVMGLCLEEIKRRRDQGLAAKREKINATGCGSKKIERSV